jgi:FdhD protein
MKVRAAHTVKISESKSEKVEDLLAAEEPLEIRITFLQSTKRVEKALSVTMRTPGNDEELAIGFLISEGIINSYEDIISVKHCLQVPAEAQGNVIRVILKDEVEVDWESLQRHFYASSSCGVCGKSALGNISCQIPERSSGTIEVKENLIYELAGRVQEAQNVFQYTGGIHAAAIFNEKGDLKCLREDIGRHNAVDKVVGFAIQQNLDLNENPILWVSGRAGFELVQKALMAGFRMMVAVGAPSSLAAELANENDFILIGFSRNERFNIYSGDQILSISKTDP